MAVSSVSSLVASSIGASAAQADSAQKNPRATLPQGEASSVTELSAAGKAKQALDDIKTSAQAIKNLDNPPTASDLKAAVQSFVKSVNALSITVRQTATDSSTNSSVIADARSAQALQEINEAVSGPDASSLAALQKLGISKTEGTLSINPRALETGLQENPQGSLSTLVEVADRVETAADRQLTGAPPVEQKSKAEAPAESQSDDARNEAQATAEQRDSFKELLTAQLANAGSYIARNAVVTYFSVAAL